MKPDRRLARTVATVGAALAVWMAVSIGLVWGLLDGQARGALALVLQAGWVWLALAWALGFALAAGGLRVLFLRHVRALGRLTEQARVLLAARYATPLVAAGTPELAALGRVVNELAGQRDRLRGDMAQQVEQASAQVQRERNQLAALMSELTQSVVVCNLDGRIVLYNRRARLQFRALSDAPAQANGAELLGIGRSIYGALDRHLIAHALDDIVHRLGRGAASPTAQFDVSTRAGQLLRVQMAPVRSGQSGEGVALLSGFVLMLDNAVRAFEESSRPEQMPAELGEEGVLGLAWSQGGSQTRSDSEPAIPMDSRPEYFDFDLFQTSEADSVLDERLLSELTYTVFDTETTGLNPTQGDQIIQLGATRIVRAKLLRQECFEQLVDPGRDIPAASIPFHGITQGMVLGKPRIAQVLPAFYAFAQDSVLVAHNAAFDMRFLQLQEAATGIVFAHPVLDTLLLSAVVHPHQASHRLEAIAGRFNVPVLGRHTALGDALVTAQVWLRLIPLLQDMGIHTLGQAREAAQKTYYARLKY